MHRRLTHTVLGVAILSLCALGFLAVKGADSAQAHHRPGHGGATATPTSEPPPSCTGCPVIKVNNVHVGGWTTYGPVGTAANCRVIVTDDAGNQIAGALVEVMWSGAYVGPDSALTIDYPDIATQAIMEVSSSDKCKGGNPSVIYTCTVTDVSHPEYTYDASQNLQTTDSDDACTFP